MKTRIVVAITLIAASSTSFAAQTSDRKLDARNAYEQGRAYLKSSTGYMAYENALASFEKAVALDPDFAPAFAELSLAYSALGGNLNYLSPELTGLQSLQAAEKAVALDGSLSDAHLALASARQYHLWDWAGTEESLKRARSLKPTNARIALRYARFLQDMNRLGEADLLFQEARQSLPDSLSTFAFQIARASDKNALAPIIAALEEQTARQTDKASWLWRLAVGYTKMGEYAKAEKMLEAQIPLMGRDIVDEVALWGFLCGRMGRKADAMKKLAQLDEIQKGGQYVSPVLRAWIFIGLNEKDQAFQHLEDALAQHAHRLGLELRSMDFLYVTVRDDPRFASLMRRLKLESTAR
jgi:Tfp pilus assembly protein PilF